MSEIAEKQMSEAKTWVRGQTQAASISRATANLIVAKVIADRDLRLGDLQSRIAGLEKENERLREDRQDLIDAVQPLLGCADYARDHDLSGDETLIVSAGEAYRAASAMMRVSARATLDQEASR